MGWQRPCIGCVRLPFHPSRWQAHRWSGLCGASVVSVCPSTLRGVTATTGLVPPRLVERTRPCTVRIGSVGVQVWGGEGEGRAGGGAHRLYRRCIGCVRLPFRPSQWQAHRWSGLCGASVVSVLPIRSCLRGGSELATTALQKNQARNWGRYCLVVRKLVTSQVTRLVQAKKIPAS